MTASAHRSDARTHRARTREELTRGTFDLLVIGGGILGTSVAWTATQAGLRVAMVDAGDFAGATSSASSKLVHGGLRYLQTGNVRLVAENHKERRSLASDVAPHLVNHRPFLVPVYSGGPHGAAKMGAGVFLYSALSAFGDGMGRLLSPLQAKRLAPGLRTEGLKSVAAYSDHQMNDSRMAVMTVRAAVDAGAVVLNHAEVRGLRTTRGRVTGADLHDRVNGDDFGIDARLVLNATGPWVDHLRRMEDAAAAPSVRLSKGAHLVLSTPDPWKAALTIPVDKYRVSFAIPWEGHLLLGTTDESYEDDPAEVGVVPSDVDQILGEAALGIDASYLDRDRMTYSFAGLRVLPGGPGDTSSAKRETVVTQGRGGMLSVAGGKWTTYRHIGRTVLEELRKVSAVPLAEDMADPLRTVPLPGLASPDAVAQRLIIDRDPGARLDPLVARHLASHYGSLALDIAGLVRDQPELGERIHPDGPDVWAQVVFARDREWAVTVDDALRRRTTVTVRGLDTPEVRERTRAVLEA
ncbi:MULTISPECIES: glycerol-3-phosphate dehydrogenase/oxidase [unclassified Nocardiopsis]|uniref:glycerol-3-phosphate dehydrogenase/oxidase n=1 Tax=unclassified Nocardiopsis TaxID=2649073 RepID=UPI00066B2B2B|nr:MULTISPECIES: glycerol-3-phosphate dehydrogenase/oxidase [unclassified Nocardiopsis]MBQ1083727.1 glycerol-3-phosphate dehydrogenase/oxidase [Nocardiopsis sp. B62]